MGLTWNFTFPRNMFKRKPSTTPTAGVRVDRAAQIGQGQWAPPLQPYVPPVPLQLEFPPVEFSVAAGPLRIEGMFIPATRQLVKFQIRFIPQQFPLDPAYATPMYTLPHAVPIHGTDPPPHHATFRRSHTVSITPNQPFAVSGEVAVGAIQYQDRWRRWHEVVAIFYNVHVREPRVQWTPVAMLYHPPQHLQDIVMLQIPLS